MQGETQAGAVGLLAHDSATARRLRWVAGAELALARWRGGASTRKLKAKFCAGVVRNNETAKLRVGELAVSLKAYSLYKYQLVSPNYFGATTYPFDDA